MKIKIISDTHNQHNMIPKKYLENENNEYSMIIHAGDVSGRGWRSEIEAFMNWFSELPFQYKIFIPGNHDFFFETATPEILKEFLGKYPDVIYLHDSGVEIEGIKIWGSGITPWFHNWAFNRKGDEIKPHWDLIPLDTDILITHGPIFGYLDTTLEGDRTGCEILREKLPTFTNLKLHVCGHIHEAYGCHEFVDGQLFLNASVLNRRYEMQNKPITLTLGDNTTLELGRIS